MHRTRMLLHWFAWITATMAQKELHSTGARFIPASFFTKLTFTEHQPSSQIRFTSDYQQIGDASSKNINSNDALSLTVVSHSCTDNECRMLIDLGKNYYPRYLHEVMCKSPGSPKMYGFKVLTKRGDSHADPNLPESLRNCWKFIELEVPVACDCPFKY